MFGLPISFDTLLSLPFLSFFLLPSALSQFSWTTSLNALLLWTAWAAIVLSHKPLHIELGGVLFIRVVFYLIPSLAFLLLDLSIPSVANSLKAHGPRGLPFPALRSRTYQRLFSFVGIGVFNTLLGAFLQAAIEYLFIDILSLRSALRITTTLPLPLALAKDLTRAFIVRGVLAYYTHRNLLHGRTLPVLARWHAQWQHSLGTTLPLGAAYDHPAAYLVHRWLPVYAPAILFRMHMLAYLLFLALVSLEEAFAWSGYGVLPSSIMLAGIARRTEAHMMSGSRGRGGNGNYGPLGLMDWAHGTTIGATDIMDDISNEVEKRDIKGKVRQATDKAGDAAADLIDNGDEFENDDDHVSTRRGVVAGARSRVSRALKNRK